MDQTFRDVCEVWGEAGREHISGTPVASIMKILNFAAEVGLKRKKPCPQHG